MTPPMSRSLAASLVLLLAASVRADAPTTQPTARSTHAELALVSDSSTVVAGQPFTVALRFKLDPSWHVYWKDPGDSGLPPSVKWSLPDGFTAGEISWPTPRVLTTPAGKNYVYDDEVALLVQITPPANLSAGTSLPIVANVKWLECDAERCLPAKATVAIPLTAGDKATPVEADHFADWHAKVEAGKSFDPKTAKSVARPKHAFDSQGDRK